MENKIKKITIKIKLNYNRKILFKSIKYPLHP